LIGWLTAAYPWIKSVHILTVIAWMAGLLYLPRLFVYHAMAQIGSDQSETFKIMERRLQRGIINPGMLATLAFGSLLAVTPGIVHWDRGWIWAKLALVATLLVYSHTLVRWRRAFADDRNRHSSRFQRTADDCAGSDRCAGCG